MSWRGLQPRCDAEETAQLAAAIAESLSGEAESLAPACGRVRAAVAVEARYDGWAERDRLAFAEGWAAREKFKFWICWAERSSF